jgi:hypothetical protein
MHFLDKNMYLEVRKRMTYRYVLGKHKKFSKPFTSSETTKDFFQFVGSQLS